MGSLQWRTAASKSWRTTAIVTWADSFTLPDGTTATNRGVHVFGLSWGKVTSLEVHCDTARLDGYLGSAGSEDQR